MKLGKFLLSLIIASFLFFSFVPALAQEGEDGTERDQEYENSVIELLATISPDAVPLFQEATLAMDAGDFARARDLFRAVLDLTPDFPPALRRMSYVELQVGRVEAAVYFADKAYQLDPSPESAIALAAALLRTRMDGNVQQAHGLAQEALAKEPDSLYANLIMRDIAAYIGDLENLRLINAKLMVLLPDDPMAYYYQGLLAVQDEDWETAESSLLKAQELGMPEDQIQKVLDEKGVLEKAQEIRTQRYFRWGAYALAVLLGLGLIYWGVRLILRRKSEVDQNDNTTE